ncbi:hypothetical protein GJ496_008537 [Pomphorhynchus laevis]|nr:hypothetical protein GJ496_008537 [Pomphorhynchus laevis]
MNQQKQAKSDSFILDIAATSASTCLVSILVTPLDLLKTRAQIGHPCKICDKKSSYRNLVQSILKDHGGIRSLWTGLGPTLILGVPSVTIYFCTYQRIHEQLKQLNFGTNFSPLLSGAVARFLTSSVTAPLELLRVVAQSKMINVRKIMKLLLSIDTTVLWNGWRLTIIRDVPFSMIYWWCYENAKCNIDLGLLTPFVSGSIGGISAAFVTCPVDVLKTKLQRNGLNMESKDFSSKMVWRECKLIYRTNGICGFWSGLLPRMTKVVPACAIMIGSYEMIKSYLQSITKRQLQLQGM